MVALTLPLAGCAAADTGTGDFPGVMAVARRVDTPFGASCGSEVPGGAQALTALGKLKALEALDRLPEVSRFAALVRTAKAQDMFESMEDVTVFVPTNAAFDLLTPVQQQKLTDPTAAGVEVRSLIVAQDLTRSDLTNQIYPTLYQGTNLHIVNVRGKITVSGAPLSCGSVTTAATRMHLLDAFPDGKA
jgi:uncharacterized surface protein with fasciclin (FAS1) repeats